MIAVYQKMFIFLVRQGLESKPGYLKPEKVRSLLLLASFGPLDYVSFRPNRRYANVSYILLLLIYHFASWLIILGYTNLVLLHGRLANLPLLHSLRHRRLSIHELIFRLLLILLRLLSVFIIVRFLALGLVPVRVLLR